MISFTATWANKATVLVLTCEEGEKQQRKMVSGMTSRWNRILRNFDEYAQIASIGRAFQTGGISAVNASNAIAQIGSAPVVRDAVSVSRPAPANFAGSSAMAVG